jgi:hypothetical protein
VYEGVEEGEEPMTQAQINRLRNMTLTKITDYKPPDDGDDESETLQFWGNYLDVSRDENDPTKPRDEPRESEEDLAAFREKLRSEEFMEKYKNFGINKYMQALRSKSGGKKEEDYITPLNNRAGEVQMSKDKLKRIWSNGRTMERLVFHDGKIKINPDSYPMVQVPVTRQAMLQNDEHVRRIMACVEPFYHYPDKRKLTLDYVKSQLVLNGGRPVGDYMHAVGVTNIQVKVLVYSNERFNDRISTKDIFLLYIVLIPRQGKNYAYFFHYYNLLPNNG